MQKTIAVTEAALRAGLSRQAIHDLIDLGDAGPFPGAYQATGQFNSPFLIPLDEFEAWLKERAQSRKD